MKKNKYEPEIGIQWYHVLGAIILGLGLIALASPKAAGWIVVAILGYAIWHNTINSH